MPGTEQQIQRALDDRGIKVTGLRVRESGRVVGLWGSVASELDRESAERVVSETMRLTVRNHLWPRESDAAAEPPPSEAALEALVTATDFLGGPMQSRRYVAKPGDTLEKVARQFYGDASAWTQVRDANADRVGHGGLKAGTELIVP